MGYVGTLAPEEASAARRFPKVSQGAGGSILEIAIWELLLASGCIILRTSEFSHRNFRTSEGALGCGLGPQVLGCRVTRDFMEFSRSSEDTNLSGGTMHHQKEYHYLNLYLYMLTNSSPSPLNTLVDNSGVWPDF